MRYARGRKSSSGSGPRPRRYSAFSSPNRAQSSKSCSQYVSNSACAFALLLGAVDRRLADLLGDDALLAVTRR